MVVSGKLFMITKPIPMDEIARRLKGYRISEEPPQGITKEFRFVTEIKGLRKRGESLAGTIAYDSTIDVNQHGQIVKIPKTYESPFLFTERSNKMFLTVVAKKWRANAIAKRINDIIFVERNVVPLSISPRLMAQMIENNTEDQVVTFFDGIKSVDKLSLYGESLTQSALYESYYKAGGIWYTVARSKRFGQVVGLGRNGVVVGFGMKDVEKFFDYVEEEVIPSLAEQVAGSDISDQG
ncbi:MAG: hypothetical protein ACP5GO_04645 [Thermoprotei archaeon]|jgi:hypothetical protein